MARPDAYQVEIAFVSNPDDPLSYQSWTDVTRYVDVQKGIKIGRGRSDEFADIQPSKLALTLDNRDGRFTPDNAASPYAPNVQSGKKIRVGVLWEGNGKQVYDGEPGFAGTAGFRWESKPGQPVTSIAQTSVVSLAGTGDPYSMALTLPTAASAQAIVRRFVNGLVTGRQYTASIYIRVPTGAPVMAFGVTPGGIQATTINDSFQRRSITFTATGPTCELYVFTQAASTAGQVVYVDAVQVEEGAVATTFEPIGAVFSWRFTGDVTDFPLRWEGGAAFYAESNAGAADRTAKYGGELREFQSFLIEDVLDDSPVAYYPLNDPAGSTSAGDISGNTQEPLGIGQVGAGGTVTFGWDHTDGAFDYAVPDYYRERSTGVRFQPSALGTPVSGSFPAGKYLRGPLKTPIATSAATVACWAYFPSAGRSDFGPIAFITAADGSYLGIHQSVFGGITAIFVNKADGQDGYPYEVTVPTNANYDAVYQFAATIESISINTWRLSFIRNGIVVGTVDTSPMKGVPRWSMVTVGGRDKVVDGVGRVNVSHVQVYDYAVLSSTFAVQWFVGAQGRGSGAGTDTTQFRMTKLCQFLGAPLTVQGTNPKLVGPQEVEGAPLDSMRLVEATEGGLLFINGAGDHVFQLRNFRYNVAPTMTMDAGKIDPESLIFPGDEFGVRNDVTASRPDGASVRYVNATSRAAIGRRKASVTAIPQTDDDLSAIAARQANGFGTRRNRITGITISLLNDPGLISWALKLEISAKLRITALPAQAPAALRDVFVEGWDEMIGEQDWSMTFNTSPAEPWDVWQLGVPGRSELGATTIVAF